MQITAQTTIEEVLELCPQTVKVFMDVGIPCLVCGEPLWGTIEEIVKKYGVDVTELLTCLNGFIDA